MTRREWTVDDRFGGTWRLVLDASAASEPSSREILCDLAHASLVCGPQKSDRVAETLFAVAAEIGRERNAYADWLRLPFDDASRLANDVREQLTRASLVGALIAKRVRRANGFHDEDDDPPSRPPGPQPEADDWVGIELVDQDGKPVPDVAYRIECENGEVRTGTTSALGKARELGLHPGKCKVTFPGLNGPDWNKVS